jgi:hypothetical protein
MLSPSNSKGGAKLIPTVIFIYYVKSIYVHIMFKKFQEQKYLGGWKNFQERKYLGGWKFFILNY